MNMLGAFVGGRKGTCTTPSLLVEVTGICCLCLTRKPYFGLVSGAPASCPLLGSASLSYEYEKGLPSILYLTVRFLEFFAQNACQQDASSRIICFDASYISLYWERSNCLSFGHRICLSLYGFKFFLNRLGDILYGRFGIFGAGALGGKFRYGFGFFFSNLFLEVGCD